MPITEDNDRLEYHCQQCGRVLNFYLRVPYEQYGVYMCSEECFSSFETTGRLDYWIRLIGSRRRESYVAIMQFIFVAENA